MVQALRCKTIIVHYRAKIISMTPIARNITQPFTAHAAPATRSQMIMTSDSDRGV